MDNSNDSDGGPTGLPQHVGSRPLQIFGGALDGANLIKSRKLGHWHSLELYWWGRSQAHKWRWNVTHIDLGPLSIYGIRRPWMWLPLAWMIKPMRMWYHWRYANDKVSHD